MEVPKLLLYLHFASATKDKVFILRFPYNADLTEISEIVLNCFRNSWVNTNQDDYEGDSDPNRTITSSRTYLIANSIRANNDGSSHLF